MLVAAALSTIVRPLEENSELVIYLETFPDACFLCEFKRPIICIMAFRS